MELEGTDKTLHVHILKSDTRKRGDGKMTVPDSTRVPGKVDGDGLFTNKLLVFVIGKVS